MQTGSTAKCQIPQARAGPNMIRVNEVSNNSGPEMPTRDKKGERRGEPRNGGGDKEPYEPEAW